MIKIMKCLMLCALLSCIFLQTASAAPISIGTNNWAENIAVANLWKLLLEEKGYPVKLQNGVAQNRIDLTFEVWLPVSDKPAFDKVKNDVHLIGPWFDEAKLGLAVPGYASIESIEQLNSQPDAPEVIVGIDSGSSLMLLAQKAREQYRLKQKIMPSSESAMLLALERAIKRKEAVAVTLWKPHIRFLHDPQGTFGESDSIYAIARKDFKEKYPDIERWLSQWKMDDTSLGGLMAEIINQGQTNPEKGTALWIENNRPLIDKWMR